MGAQDQIYLLLSNGISIPFPHSRATLWLRIASPHAMTSEALAAWWDSLDADEQAHISRLISPERRREALAAHGLLRHLISDILSMPADRLRFIRHGRNGKPMIDAAIAQGMDVNLTHCADLVGCVAAKHCLIGIDMEPVDRPLEGTALDTLFAAEEQDWLRTQPSAKAHENFIRLWTLKEAVLKATGHGLSHDLASFAVLPSPARIIRLPESFGALANWRIWQLQPTPRHILAVAAWHRGL